MVDRKTYWMSYYTRRDETKTKVNTRTPIFFSAYNPYKLR